MTLKLDLKLDHDLFEALAHYNLINYFFLQQTFFHKIILLRSPQINNTTN